mgnify:FL=1
MRLAKLSIKESERLMKKTVAELSKDLDSHEQVCSERSKNIELQFAGVNARLKRLEVIIMSTTAAIILMLITVVMQGM